jgi:hypothetical protein
MAWRIQIFQSGFGFGVTYLVHMRAIWAPMPLANVTRQRMPMVAEMALPIQLRAAIYVVR